jgi:hypothetical protein
MIPIREHPPRCLPGKPSMVVIPRRPMPRPTVFLNSSDIDEWIHARAPTGDPESLPERPVHFHCQGWRCMVCSDIVHMWILIRDSTADRVCPTCYGQKCGAAMAICPCGISTLRPLAGETPHPPEWAAQSARAESSMEPCWAPAQRSDAGRVECAPTHSSCMPMAALAESEDGPPIVARMPRIPHGARRGDKFQVTPGEYKSTQWMFDVRHCNLWHYPTELVSSKDNTTINCEYFALHYGPWWYWDAQRRVGSYQGICTTLAYAPAAVNSVLQEAAGILREVFDIFVECRLTPSTRLARLFHEKRWMVYPSEAEVREARHGYGAKDPRAPRSTPLASLEEEEILPLLHSGRIDLSGEVAPTNGELLQEMFLRKTRRDRKRYARARALVYAHAEERMLEGQYHIRVEYDQTAGLYWRFADTPANAEVMELLHWLQDALIFRAGIQHRAHAESTTHNQVVRNIMPPAYLHATGDDHVEVLTLVGEPPPVPRHKALRRPERGALAHYLHTLREPASA